MVGASRPLPELESDQAAIGNTLGGLLTVIAAQPAKSLCRYGPWLTARISKRDRNPAKRRTRSFLLLRLREPQSLYIFPCQRLITRLDLLLIPQTFLSPSRIKLPVFYCPLIIVSVPSCRQQIKDQAVAASYPSFPDSVPSVPGSRSQYIVSPMVSVVRYQIPSSITGFTAKDAGLPPLPSGS